MATTKVSPFVLTNEALDRLLVAAADEPATLDLVGSYRRAADDLSEMSEMVRMELDHFGITPA